MTLHAKARVGRANILFFRGVVLALVAAILPACSESMAQENAANADSGVVEEIPLYKVADPPGAETNYFLQAIDEELFIGIAVSEQGGDAQTLNVYVCDGETVAQWFRDDQVTGGEATLTADGATVEISAIDDESVSGTFSLDGGEAQPFTAELATGDGGLYRAEWTLVGSDYRINWVVLDDGRQRGGMDGKGNDVYPPPIVL